MLFAFEVGSTLMLTAGLGFLGYYIGGDVWVDVDDFVARRTSGNPELGQMLATAWVRLTDPWGLVAVGSVVFTAVLGFNLLGEGLRLRIDPESEIGRIRWLSDGIGRLRLNLEQAWYPVGRLLFGSRLAVSLWMAALGFGAGYAGVYAWQAGLIKLPEPQTNLFFEEQPEATPTTRPADPGSDGDSGSQTLPTEAAAVEPTESVISAAGNGWSFTTPEELLVNPLVHTDGSLYLLTAANAIHVLAADGTEQAVIELPEPIFILEEQVFGGGAVETPFTPILAPNGSIVVASDTRLYAIDLDGAVRWEFPLDDVPHSPPIAGPDGTTYFQLDRLGSLYAFSPEDGLLWKHDLEDGLRPAFFFPVISSTGDIFYSITNGMAGQIEALSPAGELLWRTQLTTFNFYRPIQITPAGDWISLDDNVVRTDTGELIELAETDFSIDQFIMGRDGGTYLRSGTTVMEWALLPGGRLDILRQVTTAAPPNITAGLPPVMNVAEDGTVWFMYFRAFGAGLVYLWADFDGTVWNILELDTSDEFVIAEDLENTGLTICSLLRSETQLVCKGIVKESADPVWEVTIDGIPRADSVQYREGVLYVRTASDTVQAVLVTLPE
jgi:hypothetical protein